MLIHKSPVYPVDLPDLTYQTGR